MPTRPQTAPELVRAENRIFRTWLHRRPTLLRDGALGGPRSTYLTAPVRVLFVLKEPNDAGARWSSTGADLRLHPDTFADLRSTFPVLLLLTALAQSPDLALSFDTAREHLRDPQVRRALLRSIALVNLKKTPGGPVCNDRTLTTAVQDDGDLLARQLALYHPDLTITGGSSVFALLAQLRGHPVPASSPCPALRPAFRDPDLGLCLSFFHPQATKGFRFLFHLLRDTLRAHHFGSARITA